jgi:hypothetical protein
MKKKSETAPIPVCFELYFLQVICSCVPYFLSVVDPVFCLLSAVVCPISRLLWALFSVCCKLKAVVYPVVRTICWRALKQLVRVRCQFLPFGPIRLAVLQKHPLEIHPAICTYISANVQYCKYRKERTVEKYENKNGQKSLKYRLSIPLGVPKTKPNF